jgi:predicted AlkP superfamily phosphohydrolase/phosphomutase
MPQYDWSQTRAFPLVTEQHGSIRVNLIGREAKGIVPVHDYATVCREVEEWLHTLTTSDGKPLARKVIRMAESGEQALKMRIPDVIVHWEDSAFRSPLKIGGSPLEYHSDGNRYLSQHTSEGFCILKGGSDGEADDVLHIKDLGKLIIRNVLRQ